MQGSGAGMRILAEMHETSLNLRSVPFCNKHCQGPQCQLIEDLDLVQPSHVYV